MIPCTAKDRRRIFASPNPWHEAAATKLVWTLAQHCGWEFVDYR